MNALSTLTNGLYTVTFTASDNAGNSKSKNQEFIVDHFFLAQHCPQ